MWSPPQLVGLCIDGAGLQTLFPVGGGTSEPTLLAQTDANDFPGGAGYLWPQLASCRAGPSIHLHTLPFHPQDPHQMTDHMALSDSGCLGVPGAVAGLCGHICSIHSGSS